MGSNCAGQQGGAEHRGVSAAQPAQLWTAAQEVWLMATCPGRAVAVCGEKRAGRAMGRRAGDHETVWAARGGRGCNSRTMEGVEFRPKNPERPPGLWRAISADRPELCPGERNGRGVPVWRDGGEAGFYCDMDRHAVSRC